MLCSVSNPRNPHHCTFLKLVDTLKERVVKYEREETSDTAWRLSMSCCCRQISAGVVSANHLFISNHFHIHFMTACNKNYLAQPLLRLTNPKVRTTPPFDLSSLNSNSNPTGSLREGKGGMERILRRMWRSRRRKQLDGGRDMPRVSSPSYPSD